MLETGRLYLAQPQNSLLSGSLSVTSLCSLPPAFSSDSLSDPALLFAPGRSSFMSSAPDFCDLHGVFFFGPHAMFLPSRQAAHRTQRLPSSYTSGLFAYFHISPPAFLTRVKTFPAGIVGVSCMSGCRNGKSGERSPSLGLPATCGWPNP